MARGERLGLECEKKAWAFVGARPASPRNRLVRPAIEEGFRPDFPGALATFCAPETAARSCGGPIHPGKAPFGRGFRISLLKPRQARLFQPFLSLIYTGVASGPFRNVEKGFAKAG